jgi:hypothetical protein
MGTMSALGQKADFRKRPCPLYPRKRTCAAHAPMSAMGQKQTCAARSPMSAFTPKSGGLFLPVHWDVEFDMVVASRASRNHGTSDL